MEETPTIWATSSSSAIAASREVPNTNPGTVRAYLWDDANGHVGY